MSRKFVKEMLRNQYRNRMKTTSSQPSNDEDEVPLSEIIRKQEESKNEVKDSLLSSSTEEHRREASEKSSEESINKVSTFLNSIDSQPQPSSKERPVSDPTPELKQSSETSSRQKPSSTKKQPIDEQIKKLEERSDTEHSHSEYSDSEHSRSEYSDSEHSHSEYSDSEHSHSDDEGYPSDRRRHSHDEEDSQSDSDSRSDSSEEDSRHRRSSDRDRGRSYEKHDRKRDTASYKIKNERKDERKVDRKDERKVDRKDERKVDRKDEHRDDRKDERRDDRKDERRVDRRDELKDGKKDVQKAVQERRDEGRREREIVRDGGRDKDSGQKRKGKMSRIRERSVERRYIVDNHFKNISEKSILKILKREDVSRINSTIYDAIIDVMYKFTEAVVRELAEEIKVITSTDIEIIMERYVEDDEKELPQDALLVTSEFEQSIVKIVSDNKIGIKKSALFILQLYVECIVGKIIKGAKLVAEACKRQRTGGEDVHTAFQIYML
jgi:hypothetical protein